MTQYCMLEVQVKLLLHFDHQTKLFSTTTVRIYKAKKLNIKKYIFVSKETQNILD